MTGPRARRHGLASATDDPGWQWAASQCLQRVAGVDEAGRGPLAGPVYAAAVVLDPARPIAGLDDSKRLTARQRERLAPCIRAQAIAWGVGSADVEEIDRLNILRATQLAMQRAIEAIGDCDGLLVDGNQPLPSRLPQLTLIGGDGLSAPIAAASILAKTERDAHMLALDARYPDYGFARHKGYGTAAHLAALRQLGPTPLHRRSFEPVRSLVEAGRD